MKVNNNRRNFIRKAAAGSLVALSLPEILSAAFSEGDMKKNRPGKGYTILFQGDSITDSGRSREDNNFNSPRALGSGYPFIAAAALLERTLKALPTVRLIVCEPFAVPGIKAVDEKWYPEFYDYQAAAREIAEKFGAAYIPFQKVYDEAQKTAKGSYWTGDGVHPTLAGAQLMASAWLKAIK